MLQGSAWLSMHGISSICQAYSKHMPSLFQAYAKPIPSTCQAYAKLIPNIFQAHAKHIPSIFQPDAKQIPSMRQACCKHIASICQACAKHIPNISQASQELRSGPESSLFLFAFWFDYQDLLNQFCIPVGLSMMASNGHHLEAHFWIPYCGINLRRFQNCVF